MSLFSNVMLFIHVLIEMAEPQLEGDFICRCCIRPFARKNDLIRHLVGPRRRADHEEFFKNPRHVIELKESSGIDWAQVRERPPRFQRTVPAVSSVAAVACGSFAQNPRKRAFFGPAGRLRLCKVVEKTLAGAETINDVIECFDESGLDLSPDEVEVASLVCLATSRCLAKKARRYAKALKTDPDRIGAVVERRQLRQEFKKWSRGLPDVTVSSSVTSGTCERQEDPVKVFTFDDPMSDVEPDDDVCVNVMKPLVASTPVGTALQNQETQMV